MAKSQAEVGRMTYLEQHQPELVIEILNLCVLAHVEEHLEEERG